jgi:hypothetical protein
MVPDMKNHVTLSPFSVRLRINRALAVVALCAGSAATALPQPSDRPTHAPNASPVPGADDASGWPSLVLLREAVNRGNAAAMVLLGARYAKGDGVPQSNAEATLWYRRAAHAGSAEGMVLLGWNLAVGEARNKTSGKPSNGFAAPPTWAVT